MEMELSEKLKCWRAERPDEWTMGEFIRDSTALELEIERLEKEVLRLTEEYNRECNEKDDLKAENEEWKRKFNLAVDIIEKGE